jgi:DNA-binding SARP family transcriptional activator
VGEGAVYLPPLLRPLPVGGPMPPAVQRIAEAPLSVVRGLPGSYIAERLAGAIDQWERLGDCVWLRADDSIASDLTQSLGAACMQRWSRREAALRSGRLSDIQLGEEIRGAPEGAVIVLELPGRVTPRITRLVKTIRPVITDRGVRMVVVAESRIHPPIGHCPDWVVPASDLLDRSLLDKYASDRNRTRLLRYAGRRGAVLVDVLAAAQLWSQDAVAEALRASYNLPSLLSRLTTVLVDQLTADQRSALEVTMTFGYWNPQMGTRPVAADELRPWVVPMEQHWGWLRPIWVAPLRRKLATPAGARHRRFGSPQASVIAMPRSPAMPAFPAARTATRPGLLEARLLGSFEVRIDGSPVLSWNGPRGTSVLRYLLAHRQHACARDEVLEEFWPDVPPAAARNRLQVAVSGLRRAFLDVTALNVVEYGDCGYRINPDLQVEVDIESFEHGLRAAGAAERAEEREEARTAYQQAIELYHGDFAADAPFEQWTLLPRESFRIKLVDALDRLSRIELADGRTDDCIATAHRMLDIDPCREDAHRLLMRCYAAQGRIYQALRQYDFCTRILRATIDASPAAETTGLCHTIRNNPAAELTKLR